MIEEYIRVHGEQSSPVESRAQRGRRKVLLGLIYRERLNRDRARHRQRQNEQEKEKEPED